MHVCVYPLLTTAFQNSLSDPCPSDNSQSTQYTKLTFKLLDEKNNHVQKTNVPFGRLSPLWLLRPVSIIFTKGGGACLSDLPWLQEESRREERRGSGPPGGQEVSGVGRGTPGFWLCNLVLPCCVTWGHAGCFRFLNLGFFTCKMGMNLPQKVKSDKL